MIFIICLVVIIFSIVAWITNKDKKTALPLLGLAIVAALVALFQLFVVVPAGHVGVIDFFGNVSDRSLKAGINIVNPLAKVVKLSIKTQEIKEEAEVPSKEGLSVGFEVSVLFHLDPSKAPDVYKTIGTDYIDIILLPQFRSVIRDVTAAYEAKALYTSERAELEKIIFNRLSERVSARGFIIEATPPRKVILPQGLMQSIEAKLRAEQESQRMEFILTKEKQEAERKRIEAKGIADFQDIVSRGISEQLLRWKGIEATEKLAGSTNSKIVIIGAGKSGLPIILDAQ